jgi:hypothetical protein
VKAIGCAAASLALSVAVAAPGAWEENRAASIRVLRILFIGNSLTAANGLPEMVEALSRAKGTSTVDATAVTTSNFSLEDHWNQGPARAAVAKGGWSVVVLQQGPSSLPESRVLLRDYARRFAADAARVGARTAFTWSGLRRPAIATSTRSASRTRWRRRTSRGRCYRPETHGGKRGAAIQS